MAESIGNHVIDGRRNLFRKIYKISTKYPLLGLRTRSRFTFQPPMVAVFSSRFPSGLAISVFFILIILLFPPLFMPQCVKQCNRTFATEGALSRHRTNCSVLALVRQRSSEVRRDKGIGESAQSTLLSRKERLQVSACSVIYLLLTHCLRFRHILHVLVLYLLRAHLLLLLWRWILQSLW